MIRAIVASLALALSIALSVVALGSGPAVARGGHPPTMLGPGDAHVHGIKGQAVIRMSKYGYVYIAGQQHSRLKVTLHQDGKALRYRDTGTHRFKSMPKTCHRERVGKGVSAMCRIPQRFRDHMFVQVWPRLGNDHVDGHTLPARFRLWVLTDAGRDVVYGGAGADFVNGAKGNDRMYGARGNDWLRGGPGRDVIRGGPGHDRIATG